MTQPAERFGRFTLIRALGHGGMGIVYEADDPERPQRVALKLAHHTSTAATRHSARFQREGDVATQLNHPNIVPVLEHGEDAGRPYIVMKLMSGVSLKDTPMGSPREEVQRMLSVVRAVDYAHKEGVIHRDLKPSNILVDENGTPYVADFGLARFTDAMHTLTEPGARLGTLQYMSPEQAEGRNHLTPQCDVYSLGAILFERICGVPLYDEYEEVNFLLVRVRAGAPPNILHLKEVRDRPLQLIVRKCLEVDPRDRYRDCGQLATDLEQWLNRQPLVFAKVSAIEHSRRWIRDHPWQTFAAVCLACSAIMFFVSIESRWRRQVTDYFRLVERARVETVEQRPGWRSRAIEAIRLAKPLIPRTEDPADLASLSASCQFGFDISAPKFSVPLENTRVLRFHPTRPWLFIASKHATQADQICKILVVHTATGETVRELGVADGTEPTHNAVIDMAVAGDGEWLVVATRNANLLIYSLVEDAPPEPAHSVATESERILQLAAFDEMEMLVVVGHTGGRDWRLYTVSTQTWKVTTSRPWSRGIASAAPAVDLNRLIFCEADRLSIVEPISLEAERHVPNVPAGYIAYHGGRLALATRWGISLHNVQHLTRIGQFEAPPSGFPISQWDGDIAFSPKGDLLLLADKERSQVHIWSTTDLRHIQTVTTENTAYRGVHFQLSPDQRLFAVTGGMKTAISEIQSPLMNQLLIGAGEVRQAGFAETSGTLAALIDTVRNPEHSEIATCNVQPSRFELLKVTRVKSTPAYLHPMLRVSPDGKRLVMLKEEPPLTPRIETFDCRTMTSLGTSQALAGCRSLAYTQDCELLAAAESGVVGWNKAGATPQRSWTRDGQRSQAGTKFPMLLPVEGRILLGDEDGWLTQLQWNDRPQPRYAMQLSTAPVRVGAHHAQLRIVAIGDGDGTLFIVDDDRAQVVGQEPSAHWGGISTLTWTNNGNLVSGGIDQYLKFWTWDTEHKVLRNILRLRLRTSPKQLFVVPSSDATHDYLLLLREGAYALERLAISRSLLP